MIENIGAYSQVDYDRGYQQGRADAIEDFIKEHTSLNFRGEPYIFITNTEYEHLKEHENE